MSHTNINEKDPDTLGSSREVATNGNVLKQLRGDEEKGDAEGSLSRPGTGDTTSTDLSDSIQAVPGSTENVPAARVQSRSSSFMPEAVVVPRSERRGLLARFTLIPEVENGYHYKPMTKWIITFLVAISATAAPMVCSLPC